MGVPVPSKYVYTAVLDRLENDWSPTALPTPPPSGPSISPVLLLTQNEYNTSPDPPVPFVTFDFMDEDEYLASIAPSTGTRRWRERGQLALLVFVPSGIGIDSCLQWADELRVLFRGVQVSGITFRGASPAHTVISHNLSGNWYGLAVTVDYLYDDCA